MFKLDDLAFGQKSYLNAVFSGFYRGCGLFGFSHFAMGAVPSGTRSFHSLTQRLRAGLSYSAPRAALALLDKLVPRQALGCSFTQNPAFATGCPAFGVSPISAWSMVLPF